MLCSRTLLFIHSKHNGLHLPTPDSRFTPLHPPVLLGNHRSVLYVGESVSVLEIGSLPSCFRSGFLGGSGNGTESICNARDYLGVWKIPWRREWLPTPHPCLENSIGREGWQAIVHGVAKSQTWLSKNFTFMSHIIWCLSFSLWLVSLGMSISSCTHVATNGIISFFLWLSNIPLHISTTSYLSIYLSVDIYIVLMSWLLWIVLLWTQGCMYLFEL